MSFRIEINCNKCGEKVWSHSGCDSTEITTERFSDIFRKLALGNECTKCIIKELRKKSEAIENN